MNELRQLRIIYGALLGAVAIYCVIAWSVGQQNASRPFEQALRSPLVTPLYVVGGITFIIAFAMRARFRTRNLPRRVGSIVLWALLEAVTIYGLVLALIDSDWRLIVPPAALSILGFALSFPQEQTL